ncbi:MAG TPA: DNA-binding response regulator, partial [Gammaproteobacteria bacterium]|nr:DNA-binding response regulator [Gammaproteobacteria bacterium]
MMVNPTVFIIDDDTAVRDSLRYLLESDNLEV